MAVQTDPWGDDETPGTVIVTVEAQTAEAPPSETTEYSCPHCGTTLTLHHDAVGSMHCYGSSCVDCCFLPPEPGFTEPRAKLEAKPCPMGQKVGAF